MSADDRGHRFIISAFGFADKFPLFISGHAGCSVSSGWELYRRGFVKLPVWNDRQAGLIGSEGRFWVVTAIFRFQEVAILELNGLMLPGFARGWLFLVELVVFCVLYFAYFGLFIPVCAC